jgi:hypothetical protein
VIDEARRPHSDGHEDPSRQGAGDNRADNDGRSTPRLRDRAGLPEMKLIQRSLLVVVASCVALRLAADLVGPSIPVLITLVVFVAVARVIFGVFLSV